MVSVTDFWGALVEEDVQFVTGVPDSLLKTLCAFIDANTTPENHVIAANEGGAVALAIGHHLATGKLPLVYMQLSGLGNAINPLLSLADPLVYAVPMILVIGWRGQPGVADEPQHVKKGQVALPMLEAMGLPYTVLDRDSNVRSVLSTAAATARRESTPYVVMVRAGTFGPAPKSAESDSPSLCCGTREDTIRAILEALPGDQVVVSTTGMASRELFEARVARGETHDRDFLTVGGMGHASQIAMGIALANPRQQVLCIDGDGAALMHLGALALSGTSSLGNFRHIVLNNGAHDSVGGQPTVGLKVNLCGIARECRYRSALRVESRENLADALAEFLRSGGPALLELVVCRGHRSNLGRPTTTPLQNKQALMRRLL